MSRAGVGVAVTTLFTIATALVPGIPDKYRWPAFLFTLVLLALACLWWKLTPKSDKSEPKSEVTVFGQNVSGNIASAGRDVHQHIYQGGEIGSMSSHKAPQPILVAIDELKTLLHEGEQLVGRFQIGSIKPTFPEVEDWWKRTLACARQNVLATERLVVAQDVLRLERPWNEGDTLRIAALFVDDGCLDADDSVGIALLRHLWGRVERLKELIAKIESEKPTATEEKKDKSTQRLDLKAFVLPTEYDEAKTELAVHLMFRNDGAVQRTIVSVTFGYRDPDRLWKNSWEFPTPIPGYLGKVQPIPIEPDHEKVETFRIALAHRYRSKVGGIIGLLVKATDPSGKIKEIEREVIEITGAVPEGSNRIAYIVKHQDPLCFDI
jgi:hypothetical protein